LTMKIKVLLADDQELVRRAIRSLLREHPEIELVGEASNFTETVQLASGLEPQVVVLDLHMKDEEAVAPGEIKSQLIKDASIVGISFWNDIEAKELAESFGAIVLLDKVDLAKTLVPTIKQVASSNSEQIANQN
jgi:DNA-binding NarL/FixJ family response regulator